MTAALLLLVAFAISDDSLISDLANDDASSDAAYHALIHRGFDAFPALLRRIEDETEVRNANFQSAVVAPNPNGSSKLAKQTVGDVVFELIQRQVEGAWPKTYRDHHALTKQNVKVWLSRHKGLELDRLRLLAATDSLASIARDIANDGFTTHNRACLEFLAARLQMLSMRRGGG